MNLLDDSLSADLACDGRLTPAMQSRFPRLADGALEALDAGDVAGHDRRAASASAAALSDCDAIALAQFSLARAAPAVGDAVGRPVLTTLDSAVRKLRHLLGRLPVSSRDGSR